MYRENKTKIALFGCYKEGNFGDDLMGVMFGKELKSRNVNFRVFGLHPKILSEHGFEGACSIQELLHDARVVIYGGGGAFLHPCGASFSKEVDELCAQCSKEGIPIYMFSVGGSGTPREKLTPARRRLLELAARITFRNREDSALLDHNAATKGEIYDDIVWLTPEYFPAERKKSGSLTIGIDGSSYRHRRSRWILKTLKVVCRLFRRPYRFVEYRTSLGSATENPAKDMLVYDGHIATFIEALLVSDVVVTHRIHLGMVAMANNIPVLQIFPSSKALILFRRLGIEDQTFSTVSSALRLIWLVLTLNSDSISRMCPRRRIKKFDQLRVSSRKHLASLATVLDMFDSA